MADPFSIVAGVVGISGIALHSTRRLKEFIDSILDAPSTITALGADSQALVTVLESLHQSLQSKSLSEKAAQQELVLLIQAPLHSCMSTI